MLLLVSSREQRHTVAYRSSSDVKGGVLPPVQQPAIDSVPHTHQHITRYRVSDDEMPSFNVVATLGPLATYRLILTLNAVVLTVLRVIRAHQSGPESRFIRTIRVVEPLAVTGVPSVLSAILLPWHVVAWTSEGKECAVCYLRIAAAGLVFPIWCLILFLIGTVIKFLPGMIANLTGRRARTPDVTEDSVLWKAQELATFIKINTSVKCGTRNCYPEFIARLDTLRALVDEKEGPLLHLPHKSIELLFISGYMPDDQEWLQVIAEQYTVAGVGSGPVLHMKGLAKLAAEESDRSELDKTTYPKTLLTEWRVESCTKRILRSNTLQF